MELEEGGGPLQGNFKNAASIKVNQRCLVFEEASDSHADSLRKQINGSLMGKSQSQNFIHYKQIRNQLAAASFEGSFP